MMKGWKEVALGKLATFRNGLNFKNESHGNGCYIIGIPDFQDYFRPKYSTLGQINPQGIVKDQDYLEYGDILFVRSNGNKDLVGRSLFIDKNIKAVFSGFCIRARIESDKALPIFIAYFTRTDIFRSLISASAGGANIQNLNQGILSRININLPPLATQRKIAEILSAYDDLIENNLKRIKLLEEKAQLTYEEWFVRMKFPGHETTPINEETGLPEGWEEKPLGEYCKILKGKNITKSTINEGKIPVVAGGLLPAYYHDTSNTKSPVITVSASGANAGFTHIYLNDIWASDCSYIDSTMTNYLFFIYALMIHNQQKIYHYQKGAAQPHVYPKDLARLESLIPTENLQQKFNDISRDIFSSIRIQRNQNQLLKEARDILLPRLMTGMIDVDKLKGVS